MMKYYECGKASYSANELEAILNERGLLLQNYIADLMHELGGKYTIFVKYKDIFINVLLTVVTVLFLMLLTPKYTFSNADWFRICVIAVGFVSYIFWSKMRAIDILGFKSGLELKTPRSDFPIKNQISDFWEEWEDFEDFSKSNKPQKKKL